MATYRVHVKAMQVVFDETLQARLDASEDVLRDGRSAVLRRAADQYSAPQGAGVER